MQNDIQELDLQRQKRASEYARIRRRLWALRTALSTLYIGLWVVLNWGARVTAFVESPTATINFPWWMVLITVAFALGFPWLLLSLPLSFYAGYTLPHRYGMSTQTLKPWIMDRIKAGLLSAILGIPLLIGTYALIRSFPDNWWAWAALGFSFFTVILAILAPVLIMPIFYKFRPLDEEYQDLAQRLLKLAEKARAKVQGVFTFDLSRRTKAANAALTGLGRTRRILLGDTLLNEFSTDEIETVLAHELGHLVHKDIPLQLLIQTGFNFFSFYLAHFILARVPEYLDISRASDPAGLPLLGLLFGLLGLITMPLTNAVSRWRENLADDYALESTQNGGAFKSAMTRLANQNLAEVDPEAWVVFLLYSHPPLRDRIRKAEKFMILDQHTQAKWEPRSGTHPSDK